MSGRPLGASSPGGRGRPSRARCYPETQIGPAPAGRPANGPLAAAMFWIKDIGIIYRVPGAGTSHEALAYVCGAIPAISRVRRGPITSDARGAHQIASDWNRRADPIVPQRHRQTLDDHRFESVLDVGWKQTNEVDCQQDLCQTSVQREADCTLAYLRWAVLEDLA